jgi:Uma2 family endonuclease
VEARGHEWVKANLIELLSAWIRQSPAFKLLADTTFELSDYDSPIPDLSLYALSRKPGDMRSGWFQGAPEVAIEVVSSEKASLLEKKIESYLAHGSKSVWVVFPEQQVVRIFSVSGESRLSTAPRHSKILLYRQASAHQYRPSSKASKLESV